MNDLKLYNVNLDGCVTYYVAARNPGSCKDLIIIADGDFEDETEITVTEIAIEAAQSILIRDDDSVIRIPLAELFSECEDPSVIACSEW